MSQFYTATDHLVLLPAIMLAFFGSVVLLADLFTAGDPRQKRSLLVVVLLGLGFTAGTLAMQQKHFWETGSAIVAFQGALVIDGLSLFFNWLFLAASALVVLISHRYLEVEQESHGEYYGLLLLSHCGMFVLAAGTELITLFVGLELMAVSFYILVGFLRSNKRSNEAAMKYLLLGAFSSGFIAYGFSILYGISGSTRLREITMAVSLRDVWDPLVFLAMATTTVGLFFKISAAPFHMWAPDAYEGAPTTVTAYLSVGSKAAAFAFLLRIFLEPLSPAREAWLPLMIAAAVASMTIGNLGALTQTNMKRLLAYSGISHAGYMLLGIIAGNRTGIQGVLIYMAVYVFMTLGAFVVITALRRQDIRGEDIDDLAGLMHKNPGYALLMLIFMLSLAGIPPTAGFIGKYYIFLSLIQTGHYVLAVLGTLYVAVALYYYFRFVRVMFLVEEKQPRPLASSLGVRLALVVTGLLTLGLGVYPEPFLRATQALVN
jgi:NADH-quinone oxidoreductase subunit N